MPRSVRLLAPLLKGVCPEISPSHKPTWVMTVGYTRHHRAIGIDEVTFDPDLNLLRFEDG